MNPWEPYLHSIIALTLTLTLWGIIFRTLWLVGVEILERRRKG